jgi:hypothetical protein
MTGNRPRTCNFSGGRYWVEKTSETPFWAGVALTFEVAGIDRSQARAGVLQSFAEGPLFARPRAVTVSPECCVDAQPQCRKRCTLAAADGAHGDRRSGWRVQPGGVLLWTYCGQNSRSAPPWSIDAQHVFAGQAPYAVARRRRSSPRGLFPAYRPAHSPWRADAKISRVARPQHCPAQARLPRWAHRPELMRKCRQTTHH